MIKTRTEQTFNAMQCIGNVGKIISTVIFFMLLWFDRVNDINEETLMNLSQDENIYVRDTKRISNWNAFKDYNIFAVCIYHILLGGGRFHCITQRLYIKILLK